MQDFPHHYRVAAAASRTGSIELMSPGLERLESAGPAEFGGPGDRWSPETLLVGAVADCLILSFRAVARASRLDWIDLSCEAEGVLDRLDGRIQFTEFRIRAALEVPDGTPERKAEKALQKAKRHCLITNSLKAEIEFETDVIVLAEPGRERAIS